MFLKQAIRVTQKTPSTVQLKPKPKIVLRIPKIEEVISVTTTNTTSPVTEPQFQFQDQKGGEKK
ncbi:WSSV022 [White spot syndrome virus]|uniref:WSSV022 n=1 Tax=White spot syndrome virus TaxID=342409 RepID=A0A2I6SBG5_9VIRU|nr:WSSV022 [White spot syndrome virus]